ncbi:MAG: site-2 protease family protein [Candidatus Gastranaerophilales bacterium]|nr:site-2 protease family protein [Candidatus Gastranaerophilales bacterium]
MNQIIMILLISLLVLVHEAGHFIAARMCGIRVTRFGIGMPLGPSWKLFRWGKTDFYLHAFLFGGYVSFPDDEPENQGAGDSQANGSKAQVCEARGGNALSIGEQSEDLTKATCDEVAQEQSENQGAGDNSNDEEQEEIPENELYESKTIAQKLFVVSAGVLMNIIFAFILVVFCACAFQKLPTSSQNLYVDSFSAKATSNMKELGVLKGDKIEKVNSSKIDTMYQLSLFAKNSKLFDDYAQADLIEKNLEQLKKLNPTIKDVVEVNETIKLPKESLEAPLELSEDVLKGLERYKKQGVQLNASQIELRNKIYSKKTYKIEAQTTLLDIATALSDTYKPVEITLKRGDKEIVIKNVKVEKEGLFGVMLKVEDIYAPTKTPKDVVVKSWDYIYTTTATMLKSLWQLFTGKVSISDMHGVIAVVKIGGDVIAAKGLLNGLLLTAMISINLAIMNFLPIPALDGGHIMFLIIEKITGRKPTREFGEKINNFFFALLILLMVAICYNDIFALVTKKF